MERRTSQSSRLERATPSVIAPAVQSIGQPAGLLMTVEQVALLWFGEVGEGGSASSNCQKIRRLIPELLPARRVGNRWYVNRATARAWADAADPASVMAHPSTKEALASSVARSARSGMASFSREPGGLR